MLNSEYNGSNCHMPQCDKICEKVIYIIHCETEMFQFCCFPFSRMALAWCTFVGAFRLRWTDSPDLADCRGIKVTHWHVTGCRARGSAQAARHVSSSSTRDRARETMRSVVEWELHVSDDRWMISNSPDMNLSDWLWTKGRLAAVSLQDERD